jgi:hypothetical protein
MVHIYLNTLEAFQTTYHILPADIPTSQTTTADFGLLSEWRNSLLYGLDAASSIQPCVGYSLAEDTCGQKLERSLKETTSVPFHLQVLISFRIRSCRRQVNLTVTPHYVSVDNNNVPS